MKYVLILFLLCLTLSCKKEQKITERYSNGKILKEYYLKNNKLDGKYKEYYESGKVKISSTYSNDLKIGSSVYYTDNETNSIDKITQHIDSLNSNVYEYYENGEISSIKEYLNIDNFSYLNRHYILNIKGDTIGGNYFLFKTNKDTVTLGEDVRFSFFLKQPLFSYNSELKICIPKEKLSELKQNFSNEASIKWDTINNLTHLNNKKKGFSDYNHLVIFDISFEKRGNQSLEGIVLETKEINDNDSLSYKVRKLYFKKNIFVKNK